MIRKHTIFTLDEIVDLKNLAKERFGTEIHLHDACGGQSFSVDEGKMTPELKAYLNGYFDALHLQAVISDNGDFYVAET